MSESANAADVAAILLAHHEEAPAPVTREQRHLAVRAAGWTVMLAPREICATLRRLGLFFRHLVLPPVD